MDDLLELGALPPGKNAPPQDNRNAEGNSANLVDFENHENKDAPPTPPLNVAAGGAAARTMGSGLLIPARHPPAVSTTGEDDHSKNRSPPPPESHTSSADNSTVENSGHKEEASPAGEPTALPTDNPADGNYGSKREASSSSEPISSSADVPEGGEVENKKETSPTSEPSASSDDGTDEEEDGSLCLVMELTALQQNLKKEILAVTTKYLEAIDDTRINALVDARVDSELRKRAKADDARDKQLVKLEALLKESRADTDRLLDHFKSQAAKPAVAVPTPAPEVTAKPDPVMATEMARLKTEIESLQDQGKKHVRRANLLKTEAERFRTWSEDITWAIDNNVLLENHNRRAVTNRIIESGFDYDTYDQKAEEPIPAWVSRPRPAGPLFKFSWEIEAAKAAKNGTGDTQPKAPDATKNTKAEPTLTEKMAAQAAGKQAAPPPAVNTTKTATPKPAGAVKANAPVVNDTTATQANGVAPKLMTPINDPSIIGRGRGRHNRGQGRDSRGRGGRGTRGGGLYRG